VSNSPLISEPEILYHYTDANGLKGILESAALWATDVRFLNDPSEFRYGGGLVDSMLQTLGNFDVGDDSHRAFYSGCIEAFSSASSGDGQQLYTTSFCEQGNLLSQWRAYGARGGGYAVGFHTGWIKAAISGWRYAELGRVEYDSRQQENVIFRVLKDALKKMEEAKIHGYPADPVAFGIGHFHAQTIHPRLLMKVGEFAEEREWRVSIVGVPSGTAVELRISGGTLVPYIVLPIPRDAIAEVTIGPTVHPERGRWSVGLLLKKFGMLHAKISVSGIPLVG
jgi:hypothetical protein